MLGFGFRQGIFYERDWTFSKLSLEFALATAFFHEALKSIRMIPETVHKTTLPSTILSNDGKAKIAGALPPPFLSVIKIFDSKSCAKIL